MKQQYKNILHRFVDVYHNSGPNDIAGTHTLMKIYITFIQICIWVIQIWCYSKKHFNYIVRLHCETTYKTSSVSWCLFIISSVFYHFYYDYYTCYNWSISDSFIKPVTYHTERKMKKERKGEREKEREKKREREREDFNIT